MATEPKMTWPEPEEPGWLIEHATFDAGAADYPDGRTKPTVVLTLFGRDVENPNVKRTLRVFLPDDLAGEMGKILPMAARDARRGLKEDEAGRDG